jgi:Holliday junction DNA helicase RuvB
MAPSSSLPSAAPPTSHRERDWAQAAQTAQRAPAFNPAFGKDDTAEQSLRPPSFADFVGQRTTTKNLSTFIQAAKARKKPLDHVLLSGPPGLGKTSLAQIISNEMGGGFRLTSGAAIARVGELAALLTNLGPMDVLCIDEIHRLPKAIEEILYPPLEDGKLDLVVGDGPAARTVRLSLSPFTLVGATTRQGLLSRPLRDRFGIHASVTFYTPEDLALILQRASKKRELSLGKEEALFLGQRARGTPRIALRLLRRLHDFVCVHKPPHLSPAFMARCLEDLGIDAAGLDTLDRRYLQTLAQQFDGGPCGIETLAAALFEERTTLEDMVEPFLIQQGFIKRTPRGRVLGTAAYTHFNWSPPATLCKDGSRG